MPATTNPEPVYLAPAQKPSILYFDKLDVFRFFSAMMVVLYHAYNSWIEHYGLLSCMASTDDATKLNPVGKYISSIIENGSYGVEIFFVISGFLITTLLLKEKQANGKISIAKFYARRSLRIWPLYYLVIAVAPLLISWKGQTYFPNYNANIFFYNNFDTAVHHYWVFPLAHFWSLCIEEHFYIFWPFIIAFVPNKHLVKTFGALILISIVYRAVAITNNPNPWYPIYLNTFARFDAIVAGALVAYIHFVKPINLRISKGSRLIVYAIFILAFSNIVIANWSGIFEACFKKYFFISITLFSMVNYLFNEQPMFNFLNNKVIRYFGKVSFGIYVYGLIVLEIIIYKIILPYHITNWLVYLLIVIAASLLIPIISYECFEKQVLKLKKRFEVVRIRKEEK
jgi:peptidoglycan/LPS O-acetylase OafA/YrhL